MYNHTEYNYIPIFKVNLCLKVLKMFKSHMIELNEYLPQEIYPDLAIERTILSLKVKCPHRKSGCEWIGELRGAQVHVFLFCFVFFLCCNLE